MLKVPLNAAFHASVLAHQPALRVHRAQREGGLRDTATVAQGIAVIIIIIRYLCAGFAVVVIFQMHMKVCVCA